MDENYFVGISDADFLQKALLSCAKDSLEFSIKDQEIQEIKKKKAETLANLKSDLSEISKLILQLEEKLPHKELLKPPRSKPAPKTSSSQKKVAKAHSSTRISYTKLERLQASLAEIEKRLEEVS